MFLSLSLTSVWLRISSVSFEISSLRFSFSSSFIIFVRFLWISLDSVNSYCHSLSKSIDSSSALCACNFSSFCHVILKALTTFQRLRFLKRLLSNPSKQGYVSLSPFASYKTFMPASLNVPSLPYSVTNIHHCSTSVSFPIRLLQF